MHPNVDIELRHYETRKPSSHYENILTRVPQHVSFGTQVFWLKLGAAAPRVNIRSYTSLILIYNEKRMMMKWMFEILCNKILKNPEISLQIVRHIRVYVSISTNIISIYLFLK
jgi:hypothetical protein